MTRHIEDICKKVRKNNEGEISEALCNISEHAKSQLIQGEEMPDDLDWKMAVGDTVDSIQDELKKIKKFL